MVSKIKTEINRLEKLGSAGSDCLEKEGMDRSVKDLWIFDKIDGGGVWRWWRKKGAFWEGSWSLFMFVSWRRIKKALHLWWRCILTTTSQACRSMLQQQTAPSIPSLPFHSSVCIMTMLVRRADDDRLAQTMQHHWPNLYQKFVVVPCHRWYSVFPEDTSSLDTDIFSLPARI